MRYFEVKHVIQRTGKVKAEDKVSQVDCIQTQWMSGRMNHWIHFLLTFSFGEQKKKKFDVSMVGHSSPVLNAKKIIKKLSSLIEFSFSKNSAFPPAFIYMTWHIDICMM